MSFGCAVSSVNSSARIRAVGPNICVADVRKKLENIPKSIERNLRKPCRTSTN